MEEKNLPKEWIDCDLNELLDHVTSGSRDWSQYYSDKGVNFIRTQDINQNRLDLSSVAKVTLPEKVEGKRTLVLENDILITITGANVGKCARVDISPPESYVSQSVALVRLVNPSMSAFIQRQIIAPVGDQTALQKAAYGMGRPVLNLNNIRDFKVKLPPLAEQEVITEKLDNLLAQVDNTKSRLERIPEILKSFRQSVLTAAVSGKVTEEWRLQNKDKAIEQSQILKTHKDKWETEKLKDFLEKGKLPTNQNWKQKYQSPDNVELEKTWEIPSSWSWTTIDAVASVTKLAGFEFTKYVDYSSVGEIPVLKAENVGKNGFKVTQYSRVPLKTVEMLPRSELFGDELLVTFVGAGVGQVARVPTDQKYFLGPNIAVVRNSYDQFDSKFLELLLSSNEGKSNLLSFSKGAAQPSLSMGQIRQTTIPLPHVAEQTEIVRRVEQLFAFADSIEQRANAALARVNNLTQSILAKAFRGELTADWRIANPDLISGDNSAEALLAKIKAERAKLSKKAKAKA